MSGYRTESSPSSQTISMHNISVWTLIFLISTAWFFISEAGAQQTEFSSTLNPVGSGARATGMGGAFIGVADDATAASWNPAGLIQLEKPEISAVYSYFHRKQEYASEEHTEMDSEQTMDTDGLNYASFAFPFILLKRNVIVSLNYQRLFEMNKEYRFPFITTSTDTTMRTVRESGHEDFSQDGFLYALSPAMAVQVTPRLSLGATYNMWDNFFGRNGWEVRSEQVQKKTRERDLPPPINKTLVIQTETEVIRKEQNSFKGENWHFGLLWSLSDSITLGGVYKTSFKADFEKKQTVAQNVCVGSAFSGDPLIATCTQSVERTTKDYELTMPESFGLGLSYRYSDSLTFAGDIYVTRWSRFVLKHPDDSETNPLTGFPVSEGRLKDTTQVRFGTEYLLIKQKYTIPFRFGLFYDPEPATGHLDDFYGVSFGSGFASDRIALDISYQYRTGRNITTDFPSAPDSDPDVNQHTVMTSAIFYF